jgi:uncharacterized membrane protein
VPALNVPLVTLSVTTLFPVPEAGLSVSQEALSLAVHVSVPLPVLLMLKVWGAGLAQPIIAVKERLVALAPMAGGVTGGGVTGGGVTGGGVTGGGVTGGGVTGGGVPTGVKIARLLSVDSLLEKS